MTNATINKIYRTLINPKTIIQQKNQKFIESVYGANILSMTLSRTWQGRNDQTNMTGRSEETVQKKMKPRTQAMVEKICAGQLVPIHISMAKYILETYLPQINQAVKAGKTPLEDFNDINIFNTWSSMVLLVNVEESNFDNKKPLKLVIEASDLVYPYEKLNEDDDSVLDVDFKLLQELQSMRGSSHLFKEIKAATKGSEYTPYAQFGRMPKVIGEHYQISSYLEGARYLQSGYHYGYTNEMTPLLAQGQIEKPNHYLIRLVSFFLINYATRDYTPYFDENTESILIHKKPNTRPNKIDNIINDYIKPQYSQSFYNPVSVITPILNLPEMMGYSSKSQEERDSFKPYTDFSVHEIFGVGLKLYVLQPYYQLIEINKEKSNNLSTVFLALKGNRLSEFQRKFNPLRLEFGDSAESKFKKILMHNNIEAESVLFDDSEIETKDNFEYGISDIVHHESADVSALMAKLYTPNITNSPILVTDENAYILTLDTDANKLAVETLIKEKDETEKEDL